MAGEGRSRRRHALLGHLRTSRATEAIAITDMSPATAIRCFLWVARHACAVGERRAQKSTQPLH